MKTRFAPYHFEGRVMVQPVWRIRGDVWGNRNVHAHFTFHVHSTYASHEAAKLAGLAQLHNVKP